MRDATFLDEVNRKSEKAWEELYRYYYASLCSYAERLTGDVAVGEDIVQECLIRMWHAPIKFPKLASLTAWLYKSVYNASISVLREKWTRERVLQDLPDSFEDDEEEARVAALREEIISHFYEVLALMPQQQQDVLRASLKGLKVAEIAVQLGISENSVKTQKKRAYLFVREHFDEGELSVLLFLLFGHKPESLKSFLDC